MKTQVRLEVAFCGALAVAFTAAPGKARKGCGCGMKDKMIFLNESRPQPDDGQLLARY